MSSPGSSTTKWSSSPATPAPTRSTVSVEKSARQLLSNSKRTSLIVSSKATSFTSSLLPSPAPADTHCHGRQHRENSRQRRPHLSPRRQDIHHARQRFPLPQAIQEAPQSALDEECQASVSAIPFFSSLVLGLYLSFVKTLPQSSSEVYDHSVKVSNLLHTVSASLLPAIAMLRCSSLETWPTVVVLCLFYCFPAASFSFD